MMPARYTDATAPEKCPACGATPDRQYDVRTSEGLVSVTFTCGLRWALVGPRKYGFSDPCRNAFELAIQRRDAVDLLFSALSNMLDMVEDGTPLGSDYLRDGDTITVCMGYALMVREANAAYCVVATTPTAADAQAADEMAEKLKGAQT